MLGMKEIKARIKSVDETAKITRATQLISASKMQKANARNENNNAYFYRVRDVLAEILSRADDLSHDYLKRRTGGKKAFLIIGSDKGLSGDYNHKLLTFAEREVINTGKKEDRIVFCIGMTVKFHFIELGENVISIPCSAEPKLEDAREIAVELLEMFENGEFDELSTIFTGVETRTVQKPERIMLIPVLKEDFKPQAENDKYLTEFVPNMKEVFDILVPQYLIGMVYSCLTEAVFSEHIERMRAMKAATDAANDLLSDLKMSYNKARQERITTEITELASAQIRISDDE